METVYSFLYKLALDVLTGLRYKRHAASVQRGSGQKIHLLLEFAGEQGEVADSWYTGNFDETYDDVVKGCEGLLRFVQLTLTK